MGDALGDFVGEVLGLADGDLLGDVDGLALGDVEGDVVGELVTPCTPSTRTKVKRIDDFMFMVIKYV